MSVAPSLTARADGTRRNRAPRPSEGIAEHLVSLPEARAVAQRFAQDNGFVNTEITESDVELDADAKEATMCVFNFAAGGFVIVAALSAGAWPCARRQACADTRVR